MPPVGHAYIKNFALQSWRHHFNGLAGADFRGKSQGEIPGANAGSAFLFGRHMGNVSGFAPDAWARFAPTSTLSAEYLFRSRAVVQTDPLPGDRAAPPFPPIAAQPLEHVVFMSKSGLSRHRERSVAIQGS